MEPNTRAIRRIDYLGGPDMAAICGESDFANVHDVWLEKMGLAESREPSINMRVGTHMENLIAQLYEERTGLALMTTNQIRHIEYPFLAGHPDRFIVDDNGILGVNEIKNVSFQRHKWGDDGSQNCPTGYIIQCMWYAGIARASGKPCQQVDITALIGNNDLRIYPIGWQEEMYEAILKQGLHFWNNFILPAREAKEKGGNFAQFAPPADESKSASKMLRAIWPGHQDTEIEATSEIEMAIYALVEARNHEEEASTDRRRLENQIKEFMQDHGVLTFPDGRITYKQSKDIEKVDWQAVAELLAIENGVPDSKLIQVVKGFTKTKPGSRRFLVPRKKGEDV